MTEFNNLAFLDEMLHNMHIQSGSSMKKFIDELKKDGYCLKDGERYHEKLRSTLRHNRDLVVSKEKAKPYKYVKKCLVTL